MKSLPQVVLNLLLNSIWQIVAVALAAIIADYLLRSTTRLRHFVWVAALMMSLFLPLLSVVSFRQAAPPLATARQTSSEPLPTSTADIGVSVRSVQPATDNSSFHIGRGFAIALLSIYFLFVMYRGLRLLRAAFRTRAITQSATEFELKGNVLRILQRCQDVFNVGQIKILCSDTIATPATLRFFRPLIVLPKNLVSEADDDALMAAIGHEVVHVRRRDYVLNLFYELMFLPVSFHPAAALIRRRIIQTRELRCDELVAERLLHPESYARSLLQLARASVPFDQRPRTVVVGIADADILEVRIMSLLKKTKSSLRRNVFLIIAAAILLAVSGVAAASWAMQFKIDRVGVTSQEPSTDGQKKDDERTQVKSERFEQEIREARRQLEELEVKREKETSSAARAELDQLINKRRAELAKAEAGVTDELKYKTKFDEERYAQELGEKEKRRGELARQARISMDQAIQIATSKSPGKVLECSLVGERWEGEGESAKPSLVLYHVVILSGDDSNAVVNHVWINAVDGSLSRSEKEERRRERSESYEEKKRAEGGVLNGRAISLPRPSYPEVAKAAGAEGVVKVRIVIDEDGNVIDAKAVSGHPLLQDAAVEAARQAKFTPTRINNEPVKVSGALVYNFVKR